MQIEKCTIDRYGKLSEFSSSFATGINLIKGPNEAGKSTLVDALTDALFENPKSRKKDIKARTSWGYEKEFSISLDFEAEGASYTLTKDFESGDTKLLKKSSGETLDDRKRVDSLVSDSLGLSNKDLFLATSCIRQDEMARIASSPEAIKDRLEALITGGKEEALASKAIQKIEAHIKDIDYKGYKHKGRLQQLEVEKTDIEYELGKANREIESMKANRQKLRHIRDALAEVKEQLEVKAKQKTNAKRAAEATENVAFLEKRFGELSSRINNIKSSEKKVKELRDENLELPRIDRRDVTTAEEQSAQKRYLESKRDAAVHDLNVTAEKVEEAKPGVGITLMSIFSLVASLGLGFYWFKFTAMADMNFAIGAGVAFMLFIIFSVIWSSKSRACSEVKTRHQMKKVRVEELEEDLNACTVSVEAIIEKYDFTDVESLRESFEKHRELEKEIAAEVKRYEGYLEDKSLKELEDDLQQVTRNLAVENEKLRESSMYVMNPEDLAQLETDVTAMESRQTKLASELSTLERHLEFAESGIEHKASLEERLEEVETLTARKKRELTVFEKTRDLIEVSRKKVLTSTLQLLDDETSDILNKVTDGRYTQVKFHRQSLKFEVYSNDAGEWVAPEGNLSRGTIDQVYLAARLALVRIISEEKHPIIILDDPFVTFDEKRRKNAIDVIKRLADKYQIFLLTCHDHYDELTQNVTTLT